MLKHSRKQYRNGIERLEAREMLAGDVDVYYSPSDSRDVVIEGDSQGNQIEVVSLGRNQIEIRGKFGTVINGNYPPVVSMWSVQRMTLRDDLIIKMGGGDDEVRIVDAVIAGTSHSDLSIDMGGQADVVEIEDSEIRRDLKIETMHGSDVVDVVRSEIGRNLTADLGSDLDDFSLQRSDVGRDLHIDFSTGTGYLFSRGLAWNSHAFIYDSLIGDDLTISGQDYSDEIAVSMTDARVMDDTLVDLTSNQLELLLQRSFFGDDAVFELQQDQDHFSFLKFTARDLHVVDDLTINTGDKADDVRVLESTVGDLDIDTGGGNDQVVLEENLLLDDVLVHLGRGNDRLWVGGNTSLEANWQFVRPYFFGDSGSDQLYVTWPGKSNNFSAHRYWQA